MRWPLPTAIRPPSRVTGWRAEALIVPAARHRVWPGVLSGCAAAGRPRALLAGAGMAGRARSARPAARVSLRVRVPVAWVRRLDGVPVVRVGTPGLAPCCARAGLVRCSREACPAVSLVARAARLRPARIAWTSRGSLARSPASCVTAGLVIRPRCTAQPRTGLLGGAAPAAPPTAGGVGEPTAIRPGAIRLAAIRRGRPRRQGLGCARVRAIPATATALTLVRLGFA